MSHPSPPAWLSRLAALTAARVINQFKPLPWITTTVWVQLSDDMRTLCERVLRQDQSLDAAAAARAHLAPGERAVIVLATKGRHTYCTSVPLDPLPGHIASAA